MKVKLDREKGWPLQYKGFGDPPAFYKCGNFIRLQQPSFLLRLFLAVFYNKNGFILSLYLF